MAPKRREKLTQENQGELEQKMNTREIASEFRLSHWAQIMRDRSASGMSIRGYCKSTGICENVYYYWQRKLREAACGELVMAQGEQEKALIPTGWAVCKAAETAAPQRPSLTIEIGGCRITVEADADLELLARTCRMLKSLC